MCYNHRPLDKQSKNVTSVKKTTIVAVSNFKIEKKFLAEITNELKRRKTVN